MAFKIRCEFWELDNPAGVGAALLRRVIADAQEYQAVTDPVVTLPTTANKKSYAMCVIGLEGSAVVEVKETPTESQDKCHLIQAGDKEWFVVDEDDKLFVDEYTAS